MRGLVVATWGDPFAWREARYKLAGSVHEGVTSLFALKEELSPDRMVVLAPETLLSPSQRSAESMKRYQGKLLKEELHGLSGQEHPEWYESLLQSLKEALLRFCEEKLKVKPEVVIMPNLGEYSGVEWIIRTEVSPDSAYAAFALLSILSTASELADGDALRVALDTTHGINFMPLAAYRATLAACRVIAAAYHIKVVFEQYNSTPYPLGASDTPELEIFKVREEVITPMKAAQRLVYSYVSREKVHHVYFADPRAEEVRGNFKWLSEIHENTGPLAAAIHYSMPLAFLQFPSEPERSDVDLMKLLSLVSIQEMGSKVRVEHLAVPKYEDFKSSLSAYALASYGRRAAESMGFGKGIVEASLEQLRRVLDSHLQGPLAKVAEHELSNLGELRDPELEEAAERSRSKGEWVRVKEGCEDQRRILVAHAGLAKRSLEIKYEGGLVLRYHQGCLDKLKEMLAQELFESTGKLVRGSM
ncbi:MAG: CRISPR-associated CARF protein Csx1 [Candidatus Korarchaeum sp.]